MLYILDRVLRLFWFLMVGLTVLAIVGTATAVFFSDSPVDIHILRAPVSVDAFKELSGARDVALNASDAIAIESVVFTSSDTAVLWPMILLVGLALALFLYGYRLLQGIVRSALEDDPFTSLNVTRIRKMAVAGLGLFVLTAAAPLLSATLAAVRLRGEAFHAEFTLEADVAGLLFVLILFALAEVMARGVELREENELTI